jgi:hypothetical protein
LARFSTAPAATKAATGTHTRVYGGLKDQDRIFTNIYGEHDTGIKGAMARVSRPPSLPRLFPVLASSLCLFPSPRLFFVT